MHIIYNYRITAHEDFGVLITCEDLNVAYVEYGWFYWTIKTCYNYVNYCGFVYEKGG